MRHMTATNVQDASWGGSSTPHRGDEDRSEPHTWVFMHILWFKGRMHRTYASALTQLFLCGSFFYKGDSLQDSPKQHTQGEDVCLSCVGQSAPHFRSHVEVRAARGGEVLPGQVPFRHTFAHFAQTKVCHLQHKRANSPSCMRKPPQTWFQKLLLQSNNLDNWITK